MFYSSEAPNGTPTIQPEQTIEFAFWKTVKTLWWSRTLKMIVRQAMSQKGSTSIRRDCTKRDPGHCRDCHDVTEYFPPSLRRNIHFPLRCGKNSAVFASLVATHLARQDRHQCILPNVSTLSTTRGLPFFSSVPTTPLSKCLSYFHAQENLSILSQHYFVALYEGKTPLSQAVSSPQLPCLLQKSQIFLQRGETRLQSPLTAPFCSLPSTQRQPDCSTHAYMSTLDWDISWSPMR